jgi:hypothetical protein
MFAIAAPVAHASDAVLAHGVLTYTAAAGEANDVTLYEYETYYVVEDGGAGGISVKGRACDPYELRYVYCESSKVSSIRVLAGDGDDTVHAENGIVEEISCGTGTDAVTADAGDAVAADCFPDLPAVVDPPVEPPVDEPPATDPVPEEDAPVAISQAPVTMDANGNVPVVVSCPATAADGCSGRVTLSLPAPEVGIARRSARVLGRSRRFKLAAGATKVVPVRLSRRSSRIIRSRGGKRRRVKLAVTVAVRTAAGTETVTSTISVAMRRSARARRR